MAHKELPYPLLCSLILCGKPSTIDHIVRFWVEEDWGSQIVLPRNPTINS